MFASYVLQVEVSSCTIKELEHVTIYVVLLLRLVTIWAIRGAHRMCFNRRIRVLFVGDCWSLKLCLFLSVWLEQFINRIWQCHKRRSMLAVAKMFIIRVHSYRACIVTWYCTRISSAKCSWSLTYWNTARGNTQKHKAGSSLRPCGSDVCSLFCALQMPHFWHVFAEFLFFEGESSEFVSFKNSSLANSQLKILIFFFFKVC